MAQFFLPKTPTGTINVSVVNDRGERLSFAADDSCGCADTYTRTYLLLVTPNGKTEIHREIFGVAPETYLHELAKHLGYDIVKREE